MGRNKYLVGVEPPKVNIDLFYCVPMTCYGLKNASSTSSFPRCSRAGQFTIACGTSAAPEHSIIRVEVGTVRIRSMKRLIHLVRHGSHAEVGRVLSGRSEIGLSDLGHAQADLLSAHLAAGGIASIHSSPRRRARETAAPIASRTGLPVVVAEALDEIDFGQFAGLPFDALAHDPDWKVWNTERAAARCPGGETMGEAVGRAWSYLEALPEEQTPALCVSHCDIIRGIIVSIFGVGFDRMFAFDCDPASLTTLILEGSDVRIVGLNRPPLRGDG
jgi:ribonuclease H / adenosylcobalamin/alpha-ribazole phosphatase